MAGVGLLALIDDIATLLDDVAVITKVAAKKTAGVLGDDLALNAEQVSGVRAKRELPVVWAVAKGSAVNKLILVPAALLLSALMPWSILPLLMLGGAYLCYEGFEKILHKLLPNTDEEEHAKKIEVLKKSEVDLVAFEKEKIKGAIRTDFILSAEIIVIALGVAKDADFTQQLMVLTTIAVAVTIGVYGLVAAIVRLDDVGFYLLKAEAASRMVAFKHGLGRAILKFCPVLMKTLSVVGTAAMFLVGGGILVHGIPHSHKLITGVSQQALTLEVIGGMAAIMTPTLINAVGGIVAGGVVFLVVAAVQRLVKRKPAAQ
mgnify:CR=1 FL=1